MWPARAHRRAATAPACLSSPSTPGRPERRHALPRTALTPSPSPSSSPPALSPSHPKHCRRRSSPPTRSPPSPRPSVEPPSSAATPLPPHRAKQDGASRGAIAVAILASGRRGYSPSIRELPGIPDLVLALARSAVSSSTVPLSSPSRSRAVAPLPTTAEASRRRPCRRRRLGPPPPKPSPPSRSWCHEGAAEPLRWPPRAPQPVPARSRAPAAAASFAPASSGLPSSSHLPHQMRESPGYAPVPSDAAPVACFTDAAASRGRRGRPRRPDGWAPSAR